MSNESYKNELARLDPKREIAVSQKHFTEEKFTAKLLKYAKKMGVKISYYSLLLFYAFKSPHTPKKAKLTIAGALGYLILPLDIIPDFIPIIGFTDDFAVIAYAIFRIIKHIDDDIKGQAHERMKKIFGVNYDEGIKEDLELTSKK